ncbi:MAG: guanylate kinase [Cyclobacteriaceae bacterium]|nr:guanylate kinase [Cyclobacteriaceae bacterium]
MHKGKAIIFSAPSGSGKTTIVKHLLATNEKYGFSISATTRPRRVERETDGKDYYFLSVEDFKKRIANDEFIEWEEVYGGNFYGTLKSEIDRLWQAGKHVLFDVDVKGGLKLKEYFGRDALAIFVKVNNMEELEARLRHRNTESEEHIRRRLAKATYEMSFESSFDITLISADLQKTSAQC